ncbi:helix-turn-helix domain-containing protein [Gilvibacter sediminis]|uniref:helix-turn-helix domain-containing protein n=1 Tax=Gilvibacter sediminis TaxID=379071 RepID=UPI00235097C5|nr:AraC family transcriptional regulator [Gilvibacter sediminis]MDC7999371.1 AraC family transcriptional regulator [Gilvibacter sediminis]
MKVFLKFDYNAVCMRVLEEKLDALGLDYQLSGFGEVDFLENLSSDKRAEFAGFLEPYNIEIVEEHKSILVQKIKDTIIDMVYNQDAELTVKSSVYLSEALGHSYGYLANLFSEVTFTSIEHFTILQKIEYTKHLILNEGMSLTEIAFKLNYSSVAHLSGQFKKTTGITPSAFQRIIAKRRENLN